MTSVIETQCARCDYTWTARVEQPKACPRCKGRLDSLPKQLVEPEPDEVRQDNYTG